jgi:hypothetical protein
VGGYHPQLQHGDERHDASNPDCVRESHHRSPCLTDLGSGAQRPIPKAGPWRGWAQASLAGRFEVCPRFPFDRFNRFRIQSAAVQEMSASPVRRTAFARTTPKRLGYLDCSTRFSSIQWQVRPPLVSGNNSAPRPNYPCREATDQPRPDGRSPRDQEFSTNEGDARWFAQWSRKRFWGRR